MKTKYILLFGIAIGLLIIISMWECKHIQPYSKPGYLSAYEGMTTENNKSTDIFSDSPSGMSCSSSSGLSNSGGGLCLSKEQQTMLQTRGGNASTGEAQIGN